MPGSSARRPAGRVARGSRNGAFHDVTRELKPRGQRSRDLVPARTTTGCSGSDRGLGPSSHRQRARRRDRRIQGLPNGYVYSIHEAPTGALCAATGGQGLVRFKGGKLTRTRPRAGLPDDVFHVLRGRARPLLDHQPLRCRQGLAHRALGRRPTAGCPRSSAVSLDTADGLRSHECVDGGPSRHGPGRRLVVRRRKGSGPDQPGGRLACLSVPRG
jgi:hypothetical protein